VVDGDHDPVGVPDLGGSHLVERGDGLRALLMHHREVDPPLDDLAGYDLLEAGRASQHLLGERGAVPVRAAHGPVGRIPTACTIDQNSLSLSPGASNIER